MAQVLEGYEKHSIFAQANWDDPAYAKDKKDMTPDIAVRGAGDPNETGVAYQQAIGVDGIDYSDKSTFRWISVIRLPDFITKADFDWAVETATRKKDDDL